jgi:hypothetical protein
MFDSRNQMHDAGCVAAAIIAAVENVRDEVADAQHRRFARIDAHSAAGEVYNTDYVAVAKGYLADGTVTCVCETHDDLPPYLDETAAAQHRRFTLPEPGDTITDAHWLADRGEPVEHLDPDVTTIGDRVIRLADGCTGTIIGWDPDGIAVLMDPTHWAGSATVLGTVTAFAPLDPPGSGPLAAALADLAATMLRGEA